MGTSVLGPELMLPDQFRPRPAHTFGAHCGERRLMAAVLEDAVLVLKKLSHAKASEAKHLVRETLAWVASDDRGWPFSFRNVCDVLDLEFDAVRARMSEIHRAPHVPPPPAVTRDPEHAAADRQRPDAAVLSERCYPEIVRRLRVRLGLSRVDLAAYLAEWGAREVTHGAVSHWEHGLARPRAQAAGAMCAAFAAVFLQGAPTECLAPCRSASGVDTVGGPQTAPPSEESAAAVHGWTAAAGVGRVA